MLNYFILDDTFTLILLQCYIVSDGRISRQNNINEKKL